MMRLGKIVKNPVFLLALAAGAWFLFRKGSSASAAPSSGTQPSDTQPDSSGKLIDAGVKFGSEVLEFGAGKAKEALGIEGMSPASLNGVVASLGGMGDLGGSFYGGY
jgi:hypothetical protein